MTDTLIGRSYGWIPDAVDHRDHLFLPRHTAQQLPPQVDLHGLCPAPYDQGQLGSCTANAIAAAIDFERRKQSLPFLIPSRLFIYFNERALEGSIDSDSGATLRNGIKTVAAQGVCPEAQWPYQVERFQQRPSDACYQAGRSHRALQYSRVAQDTVHLKSCLASGYPFVFGFSVYANFESDEVARTGKVMLPAPGEESLGGHAVMAVGYSDASQRFLVRNSWGPKWGVNGYFTIPYEYLSNSRLSNDYWTIRLVQ